MLNVDRIDPGWKVSLTFNVSQKDEVILSFLKRHLECGTIFSKGGGVWMFEVNNLRSIQDHVNPFFRRFGFYSAKRKRDFSIFQTMTDMLLADLHLTCDGIRELLNLRENMNDGGKRKYSKEEILANLKD
jgi:LAGLIDADG endonuclease